MTSKFFAPLFYKKRQQKHLGVSAALSSKSSCQAGISQVPASAGNPQDSPRRFAGKYFVFPQQKLPRNDNKETLLLPMDFGFSETPPQRFTITYYLLLIGCADAFSGKEQILPRNPCSI